MNGYRSVRPATAVWLVAKRELDTRLRSRGFFVGTIVILVVMFGYLLLQANLFSQSNSETVGLSGQASAIAAPLKAGADQAGVDIEVTRVADPDKGKADVENGELDVLVAGSPADLQVTVKSDMDQQLRALLDGLSRQEVLNAKLVEAGQQPQQVMGEVNATRVDVSTLERPDPAQGQRIVVAMVMMFLLYMGIASYGALVAQGVVEEKSSRVVEILLSTVRPWHLLLGKVLGLGLVGLAQLLILGVVGLIAATSMDVLTITGVATTTLVWGVVWYLLGFFLYATVYAAAGSLVSRQEDMQQVLTPVTIVLLVGFVAGFSVIQNPDSTAALVLSFIPPLSPILMPSRIATGSADVLEVVIALVLTLVAIAVLTWLAGRIYRTAILRTGSRMSLTDALKTS